MSLSPAQCRTFATDGYVVLPDFFTAAQTAPLIAAIDDETLSPWPIDMKPSAGQSSRFFLWTDLPDNAVGRLAADPELVTAVVDLLGEDAYHWHSKVMLKVPGSPGEWEWHQDYGYWYDDGCPYPRMLSAMVVLDRATRANGCLKVLAGSHLMGRLDHERRGDQRGAEPGRVADARALHEERWLEAEPGSVILFHCTLLHSSEPNTGDAPRRALISSYNAMSNVPRTGPGHGRPVSLTTGLSAAVGRLPCRR